MIVARVHRTLIERKLVDPGMRVLVACSGGPDSTALLFALSALSGEFPLKLEVASVDHGLRASSRADLGIARAQAARLGLPFHALAVRVPGGGSLQERARTARYDALWRQAQAISADRIAVGHTQDDQAETVLLRVLRGAGLLGVSGIVPARGDGVIRPLIDCSRAETHAFAARHDTEIASDPSNEDARFERVRVRTRVLPALLELDPAVMRHLSALADDARAALEVIEADARPLVIAALASRARPPDQPAVESFDLSGMRGIPRAVARQALRGVFAALGDHLGRAQLEQLEHALEHGGEVWLPGNRRATFPRPGHCRVGGLHDG